MFDKLYRKVWSTNAHDLSWFKRFWLLLARTILLTYRGFMEDRCMITSSGLTYYTLLGIIPIFALFISINRGFGLSDSLKGLLVHHFYQYRDVINHVFLYAGKLINFNTGNILMSSVGIIFVFWAVIRILNCIEVAMNDVWRVKVTRSLFRKYISYIVVIILVPLLVILFLNFGRLIENEIQLIMVKVNFFNLGELIALNLFNILNFLLICFVFVVMYTIFPNTQVKFWAAFTASVVICIVFFALQALYVKIQVMSMHYSVIYGSIAIVPLFVLWMRMNWLIIMIGAEMTYALQSVFTYEYYYVEKDLSITTKRVLHILILHKIIKQFQYQEVRWECLEFSKHFSLPTKLVNQILATFVDHGVILKIHDEESGRETYLPAKDIHTIHIADIYELLENNGDDQLLSHVKSTELSAVITAVEGIYYTVQESRYNQLVKDIGV